MDFLLEIKKNVKFSKQNSFFVAKKLMLKFSAQSPVK
jgi:hypothetical protein